MDGKSRSESETWRDREPIQHTVTRVGTRTQFASIDKSRTCDEIQGTSPPAETHCRRRYESALVSGKRDCEYVDYVNGTKSAWLTLFGRRGVDAEGTRKIPAFEQYMPHSGNH